MRGGIELEWWCCWCCSSAVERWHRCYRSVLSLLLLLSVVNERSPLPKLLLDLGCGRRMMGFWCTESESRRT